jgi:hypothetical protein
MNWEVIKTDSGIHVMPQSDTDEHTMEITKASMKCSCSCMPRVIVENGVCIFIHGAFDGREAMEEVLAILNKQ